MAKGKTAEKSRIKSTHWDDKIFGAAIIILSILIFIIILYPLWFVVIASISNSDLVNRGAVTFLPKDIRFYGYQQILQDSRIWIGYANTILYVVVGTLLNMAVTMPAAYALSRKKFKARNVVMFYFVFTMFFNGGLVPTYMTVSNLNLISTRAILIIFGALNVYNLIIARTFIENSIPDDLYEAALLDGCTHFNYFFKVVLPLSKAVISVLLLYYAVGHWNDFFNPLIYNNNSSYEPLQIVLRRILLMNEAFEGGSGVQGGYAQSSADQVKYAIIIVSTVPILCVYPFVQKYFEKGVMIGAVKG
ncbi:MAG: carbohydrate ABC transporter permease [Fusicatenibacter sp.]|nr:carbohydrate ABC transporter permease [Fusicatenibacter sp.]